MPLHKKKKENIPVGSKRFSLLLRKSFGSFENSLTRDSCVDISGVLGYFLRTAGIYISLQGLPWQPGVFFNFIWHNFHEGSMSIDRNIGISPYVCSKRFSVLLHKTLKKKGRFVDNTWNWILGAFENHGYVCFRASLVAPVIWHHFQWPPAQRWLSSSAFIRSN